jgi:macrolide-specific efflux system membrane fusion protein
VTIAPPAGDAHTVLVLDARGQPQPRRVRIGLDSNLTAEVRSGLQPGETVVVGTATPSSGGGRPPPPRPM